ncbi:MAG: hypothetical protein KF910_06430 [Brevundimonas sp.]|uniref:hypothetical protein n=1 Tax=Brevundimonas sp. TaxID=1871086 RepID=UPI0025BFBB2E|nr:hypothetical protein [Brevundimonas sp.]MBX3477223.1 hypothetical protein [Brevundimonas sp.]
MNLFGRELGPQEIASLVAMLALLAYWLFVLRGERGYARWFKQWEAERKARRDAELARERGEADPEKHGGPWG